MSEICMACENSHLTLRKSKGSKAMEEKVKKKALKKMKTSH
jgi:hypothetical protein